MSNLDQRTEIQFSVDELEIIERMAVAQLSEIESKGAKLAIWGKDPTPLELSNASFLRNIIQITQEKTKRIKEL